MSGIRRKAAILKAAAEYKKYHKWVADFSTPVEQNYLETIKQTQKKLKGKTGGERGMSADGWEKVKLGDYINIKHGYAFKGEFFSEVETKDVLVTPGNFKIGGGFKEDKLKFYNGECQDKYILKPNDVIVTMTDLSKTGDTLGYSALVPHNDKRRYLHNQRIGLVEFMGKEIFPLFLYWRLRNKDYQNYIVSSASGTTVKHTSPNTIRSFTLNLPPLLEQKAIADTLSCLDDKIELNNHINKNLEEIALAIFKSWFVDFEPFQDGEFEDSKLGRIPKGWRVGTISDLGDVIGGSTPSKACADYYTNNGIAWITPKDLSINKNKFISKGEIDITDLGLKNSSAKIMPKDTVLFSSRAPIGYIAIAKNEVTTNQGFKSIVPKQNIGTAYVYYYLQNNIEVIKNRASGSTFKEVSGSVMKQIPALIPNDKVLKDFKNTCSLYFEKQMLLETQNQTLSELRDTLLPKLMSGEIRVPVKEVQ
jgi:type I restriction enzyme S subunit